MSAYLRLSFTDRCNLRCRYCMPEKGVETLAHSDVLRFEEYFQLLEIIDHAVGLHKIRITGGEPLVRRGAVDFLRETVQRFPHCEVSLTTNATALTPLAADIAAAGIRRVNISLDTLKPEGYRYLTRWGELSMAMEGIAATRAAGLTFKLNAVLLKSINGGELARLVDFAMEQQATAMRFIELMAVGEARVHADDWYLSAADAQEILKQSFDLGDPYPTANGYAMEARRGDATTELGFIPSVSEPFCTACDRLRLDSTGGLRQCLFADDALALGQMLRRGDDPAAIGKRVAALWNTKGSPDARCQAAAMNTIGG